MRDKRPMEKFDIFSVDGHKLRVLAKIFETKSISRTAEAFDLNQSTISHTLDRLRAAIGDPLFVKAGRGIEPTEKAIAMMPRVLEIVGALEGLVAPERYDPAADQTPFVLAIPTPALLPETQSIYLSLSKYAPKMRLELARLAPRELLSGLLQDSEADLAVSISNVRYPSFLNHVPFQQDQLVVFYDPTRRGPVTNVEDYAAAQHAVVNFGGNSTSFVETELNKLNLRRSISFVAPTASMLGTFIKGTDLIATMPSRLANSAYEDLSYCAPPFELPPISYDLIWHRRYENSARNIWLRDITLASRVPGSTDL